MAQTGEEKRKATPVRARALLVSFLFAAPVCYTTTNQHLTTVFSIIVPPVGLLLFLLLVNILLRAISKKAAFNQADLVVIFGLSAIAASVGSEFSFLSHAAIHQFPIQADTSDIVREKMLVHLPDWLIVKDKASVNDILGGGRTFAYVLSKLPTYIVQYGGWVFLLSSICLAMFCINSLMRDVWCSKERLSFPLIQLPVAIADKGGQSPLWRSKTMWAAFGIMFGIDMLNGIHYFYPNVPSFPTKILFDVGAMFKDPPYVSLGYVPIAIFPFLAVLAFFIPNDMVFSVVFFYLLRKITHLVLASQGYPQGLFSGTFAAPGPPYFDEQTWGGVLALFVGAMVFSRQHLQQVWKDIRSGAKAEDGGISHRWAFGLLVVSFLATMSYGVIGSLPFVYMALYVAAYLVFSVVLTRIRAQVGPPLHEFAFFGPNSLMNRFYGTKWISDRQATWINQIYVVMNRIHRNHPMPYQLEAMKMGQLNNLNQRSIFVAGALITVFALVVSHFFLHVRAYRLGDYSYWAIGEHYLRMVLDNKRGPDTVGITMTLFGFCMVMVMDTVRFRFPGFPLHPAGYVVALNYGVDFYWFGLLLALLVKVFVQKYYGLKGYDKLRNVGIGIMVGEYAADTIWTIWAMVMNESTYTISTSDRSFGRQ